MEKKIRIEELSNTGDARGFSFAAPPQALEYVGQVADLHLASNRPGTVRGNHCHLRRRSAIVVLPGARWSLHWDEGEGTTAEHRGFDGRCAVLVLIAPGASHAVRNDGDQMLWWVSVSSAKYDPGESVARKVV